MGNKDNPAPKDSWHKHKYYDKKLQRWVEKRCNCATGVYHVTPREK